jgi:hypothetical protein
MLDNWRAPQRLAPQPFRTRVHVPAQPLVQLTGVQAED